MAQVSSGIAWTSVNGHMALGFEVLYDEVFAGSATSHVYFRYHWLTTYNIGPDNQVLDFSYDLNWLGTYSYSLGPTGAGTNQGVLYTYDVGNVATQYGGGPTWNFGGSISGVFDGSAPSGYRSFTLPARPASVPGAPPTSVSSVTASGATVTVGAAATNGSAILEYQAQVSTTNTFTAGTITHTLPGSGSVSGLAPATNHYVRARARNAVGWGPYSTTVSFTTGATTPGVPTALAIGSIGQTSANATYTAPATGGSAITRYDLQIALDSGFTTGLQTFADSDGSPTALSSLVPGTPYWARVRAVNGVGEGSYSSAVAFTTLAGTPTIVAPTAGSTQTNGIGNVTIEALGIVAGRLITVELSKSSTFASGIKTMTATATGTSSDNRYTISDTAQKLDNGVWYARAKVTNVSTGYVTPWSTTVSYTQSHTPSATIQTPTAGTVVQYEATTAFTWQFNDAAHPNDTQSSYELAIENNATGASVYTSGKLPLTTSPSNKLSTITRAISDTLKNVVLRWRVRVWDSHDQVSPWSGYSLFTLADPPVVAVVTPAPALPVDNGAPTFSWTVAIPSGGTQASATVQVWDNETSDLVWQASVTGAVFSITPPSVVLQNAKTYFFTITSTDTNGLIGSQSNTFTTEYQAPDTLIYSIDGSGSDEFGYNEVDWTAAAADPLFVSWKVYRKTVDDVNWTLLETFSNQNVRTYRDYMLVAGETYMYSVTQVAMRSGVALESSVGYHLEGASNVPETREFDSELNFYWILSTKYPEMSVRLDNVISDPSTLEVEEAVYTLIGRGRHVDYGDELGYIGTLTCQIRQPERTSTVRKAVEDLRRAKLTCYLRTPFGRLFPIAIGSPGWTPLAGTGTMEMGELAIPYKEVG